MNGDLSDERDETKARTEGWRVVFLAGGWNTDLQCVSLRLSD